MRGFRLLLAVLLLCGTGIGIAVYKNREIGVPLLVGKEIGSWLIESKITFLSRAGKPVTVRLSLPEQTDERGVSQEAGSLGYGFLVEQTPEGPVAVWSSSQVKTGAQSLYYQLRLERRLLKSSSVIPVRGVIPVPVPLALPGSEEEAAQALVEEARRKSADARTMFQHLMAGLTADEPTQELTLLRRYFRDEERASEDELSLIIGRQLLARAGIPSRRAFGLKLDPEMGPQPPIFLIEYSDGVNWYAHNPEYPAEPLEDQQIFVWCRGEEGLLTVFGGDNSKLNFTIMRDEIPLEKLAKLRESPFLTSTILGLPASERAVFRYLVLIPLGAFVVVIMRNLVGLTTLGTFMPVLLALAFLEMDLMQGIVMFGVIVAIGLYLRFLLSSMNLLVVPRVAACVVIVTLLMLLLSLVSWQLGIRGVLKITLFPMIIIAWTIERMSLIWEEEGKRNALTQVMGSVVVAVIAYSFMQIRQVQYWAQYFPELLLVLLAVILLLGRYTGYRLSELVRFRNFKES